MIHRRSPYEIAAAAKKYIRRNTRSIVKTSNLIPAHNVYVSAMSRAKARARRREIMEIRMGALANLTSFELFMMASMRKMREAALEDSCSCLACRLRRGEIHRRSFQNPNAN